MTVKVAVIDPLPIFRDGVSTALSPSGFTVDTPVDVLAWARSETPAVVVLTLSAATHWDLLRRLAREAQIVVVLLEEETAALGARALRHGARAVLPRTIPGGTLLRTVQAALDGQAVMPLAVAAELASSDSAAPGALLTEQQAAWLRELAGGLTVAQLAERAGYSERAMFRLLNGVYRAMGARTRVQAIMKAQELGLLGTVGRSGSA